ncbi:hypothetical protein [Chelatococcus reniformis]|uniref:hypothetical protein n=1 Tax=Chelatococcus reniformis TaxID=1494448 RepID=UPI00166F5487
MVVTLPLGAGLTALLGKVTTGQLIESIKIEGVTDGERPRTVFELTLKDVAVTHVGDGSGAQDQLSFATARSSWWPTRCCPTERPAPPRNSASTS